MRIPETIIEAAEWGGENLNHVIIQCKQNEKEDIKELFEIELTKLIIKEMIELVEQYGEVIGLYPNAEFSEVSADEDEMGASEIFELEGYFWGFDPTMLDSYDIAINEINEGWLITYSFLAYAGGMGDYFLGDSQAMQGALKKVVEKYPHCSYLGCEAYSWSDVQGSDYIQKSISSNHVSSEIEAKSRNFIGSKIQNLMKNEEIWRKMTEMERINDVEEIIQFIDQYKEYVSEDALKKLEEMLG